MRTQLSDILDVTLDILRISHSEWDKGRKSRVRKMVLVKQIVSLIGKEAGYTPTEIASFLGIERTTVIHHQATLAGWCQYSKEQEMTVREIRYCLNHDQRSRTSEVVYAWLSRSLSGLLLVSPSKPELFRGYWFAEGSKPFYPQDSFPQVTYESGPQKVRIKITLEE